MRTVIRNGTIVTHDLTWKADVAIEGGRIVRGAAGMADTRGVAGGLDIHAEVDQVHQHLNVPLGLLNNQ